MRRGSGGAFLVVLACLAISAHGCSIAGRGHTGVFGLREIPSFGRGDLGLSDLAGPPGHALSVSPVYLGSGQYECTYTPTASGAYSVSILMGADQSGQRASSGTHIYCGLGEASKCSPFRTASTW